VDESGQPLDETRRRAAMSKDIRLFVQGATSVV